jgi:hypothetical protein
LQQQQEIVAEPETADEMIEMDPAMFLAPREARSMAGHRRRSARGGAESVYSPRFTKKKSVYSPRFTKKSVYSPRFTKKKFGSGVRRKGGKKHFS